MSRRSSNNFKDPSEGIRQVLGKHVKILLKVNVKLEKGGDKTDPRILVFSPHRLFVMTAKIPTKIDNHFHYLDIQSVESKKHNQVIFRINDRNYGFRPAVETQNSEVVDSMIITLARAIRSIFPGVMLSHVIPKVEVLPVRRIQTVLEMKPLDFKDMGPCGGFSTQYACYCDYYSLPYREEVAWDVDTIYFSHDTHEMHLADFEHLDQRDLICIISALEHNTWFSKLRCSTTNTTKLSTEVLDKILAVVAKSMSLQEIHLASAGVRWEFFQRLSSAMSVNQYCNLTTLDISMNLVEDRGLASLAQVFSHLPRGTRHLNLAHTGLSGRGVNSVCGALITNKLSLNSLTYLNLAGNILKEEVSNLTSFLAQPNMVSILDLSSTEVPAELLFGALVRGCTQHLSHLNLARNPFTARKSKGDVPSSFKQFFATTLGLKYLNMSHGKLPLEALKSLLLGLACNQATSDVELNISANNLGAGGASVMENALPGVNCVSRLDLSENGFDVELSSVVQGVTRMKGLLSLNISKNMAKTKARDVVHVMEAIVQLIQEEESSLTKLNLSDCKLKTDINNVINALGSNQCLQVLDISGNGMGDVGARLLAKALQINTRLRTVHLDRNGISLQGYQDITYALSTNFSMRHIPFPTFDMQPAMKTSPERVDAIIRRMQESLQRNSNPRAGSNSNFRLTQGFLLGSTQQVLDKWCAQVQDTANSRARDASEPCLEIQEADGFVKDAEKCKLLLSSLHEASAKRDQEQCPINQKLAQISSSLSSFLVSHLESTVESMLSTAGELCPNTLRRESRQASELRMLAEKKARVPGDFISSLVRQTIGAEIHNKVNEINLLLANHISDKVIDEVIDNLARSYKGLVGQEGLNGSMKKNRSLTPDVLKGSSQRLDSLSHSESGETGSLGSLSLGATSGGAQGLVGDNSSQKSSPSPLGTPSIGKRKSLQDRKLRPKSIVDNHHSDDYAPDLLHNMRTDLDQSIEEQDSVGDLPEIPLLQHLGKARPKRPKKHAASKSVVGRQEQEASVRQEGIDEFFNTNREPEVSGHVPLLTDLEALPEAPCPSPTPPIALGRSSPEQEPVPDPMTTSSSGKLLKAALKGEQASPSPLAEQPSTPTHAPAPVKKGGALSCLKPSTLDEDLEPLTKSPEKKPVMSPSGRSISDIFGKVAADKLKPKPSPVSGSISVSPFPGRKSETDVTKRRSFFTPTSSGPSIEIGLGGSSDTLNAEANSAEGESIDGVNRRQAANKGLGGDLLKEMRVKQEKRASVVPKTATDLALETRNDKEQEENPFGGIKLRSTGRGSNLTSPSLESCEVGEVGGDSLVHSTSGSIIGLRAATFDTSNSSKSRSELAEGQETEDSNKPRPPPKPRPWSIVGVDRKSGELTQVDGRVSPPSPLRESSSPEPGEDAAQGQANRRNSLASRGSVRDMIANLNKPEKEVGGTVGGLLGAGSVRERIASMNKPQTSATSSSTSNIEKNSLPRNNEQKSPVTTLKNKNSPKNFRKESSGTQDDPRILKLEDDFMYEDTVNV